MKKALLFKNDYKGVFKRAMCMVLVALLCLSLAPIAQAETIDFSAKCTLTPDKDTYSTGETIHFKLDAQYASPGDTIKPQSVTFAIPIPSTPTVDLPMFNLDIVGTGDYKDVPMYPIVRDNQPTINLYLMTDEDTGDRWIEFTLAAGSTVQGELRMSVPNGTCPPIPEFTLTPEIISKGNYGQNVILKGGSVALTAEFGWTAVSKNASTNDLGVIGAQQKSVERIDYTIEAESLANALRPGSIYTKQYVLTDTLTLAGMHLPDGELSSAEKDGVATFSLNGVPVLEIVAPLSALKVEKIMHDGNIGGFTMVYTVDNTSLNDPDVTPQEVENLSLFTSLFTSSLVLNTGSEDTYVKNSVAFDAYSPFYDANTQLPLSHHVHSEAEHTAYTQDRYQLTKEAFLDEACTEPATTVNDGSFLYYKISASNNGASTGPFTLVDIMPIGLSYESASVSPRQDGNTLTWENLTIPSGGSTDIVLKTKFSAETLTDIADLKNVANLYAGGRILVSASALTRFLTGEVSSSEITFGKSANKDAPGLNEPLTYTIEVKNSNKTSPKLITVTDKWPGEGVIPTGVNCEVFKLLDADGKEWTIEELKDNPSVKIDQIKCYNILVPAGGTTKIEITGKITQVLDQLVNNVYDGPGLTGGPGTAEAKTYGVRIEKTASAYDDAAGKLGGQLTDRTPVSVGDTVCYTMKVKNLKTLDVTIDSLTDKLPIGMVLQPVSYQGVNSSVILQRGSTYSALSVTGDTDTNYQTAGSFDLAAGETVYVYLFAKLTDAALVDSTGSSQRITNYAYVSFNGIDTGDASANIYVYRNNIRTLFLNKTFKFVADFNDNLEYAGTWLQYPDGGDVPCGNNYSTTATLWKGAYVGYQVQIKNTSALEFGNVDVYEIIDTLPEGMEFVGVAADGQRASFDNLTTEKKDLKDKLIFAGQSGEWKSGKYSSKIAVAYDGDTRQLHIKFVAPDGSDSTLPVIAAGTAVVTNEVKPFFLIVARVKDSSTFSSYKNTVAAKVDNNVSPVDATVDLTTDGEFNYLSAYCIGETLEMCPGILKSFVGHFFPGSSTVETTDTVNPGESLRYEVQLKNQGIGDAKNAENANYRDFNVVDILPPEYSYALGSATIEFNAAYDRVTGLVTAPGYNVASYNPEPAIRHLSDGSTELTWTFTGVDTRLKSSTLSSGIGYMHRITYDTNWNTAYSLKYGNYTNTAYFNLNPHDSFTTTSTGTRLESNANTITNGIVVSVFGAVGTTAIKYAENADKDTTSSLTTSKTIPVKERGSEVLYTLEISNSATNTAIRQMQSLVIIDELSRAEGDTGVVNRIERGSEFSVYLGESPNVTVTKEANGTVTNVDPGDYVVSYGNSNGGLTADGDWAADADAVGQVEWEENNSDGKNALRVAFDPEFSFKPGETVRVQFTAVAGDDADVGETARNSFGYTYQAVTNSGEISNRFYAEPESVGITVPGSKLIVTKQVVGDGAPKKGTDAFAEDVFTFELKKGDAAAPDMTYYVDDGTTPNKTDAEGQFQLLGGQTATFTFGAEGAYTVEENVLKMPANYHLEDTKTETSTEDNDIPVDTVTITNRYSAPKDPGNFDADTFTLNVTKKVEGTGAPATDEFTFVLKKDGAAAPNVSYVLGGTTLTTNENGEFKLKADQTAVFTSDTAIYTVEESEKTNYTSAKKETSETNATTVTFTNTYTAPADPPTPFTLKVTKKVQGNGAPADATFTFVLKKGTVAASNVSYVLGGTAYTTNTDGEFKLKANQTAIFSIDTSDEYYVQEPESKMPANFSPSPTEPVPTESVDADGKDVIEITFTNVYEAKRGELSLSKNVSGELASKDTYWHFIVTFSDGGTYSYTGSASGTLKSGGTVTLKHGQSIVFSNIPVGTTYTVTEQEANNDGYYTTSKNSSGVIGEKRIEVEYKNYKSTIPPAGDSMRLLLWSCALAGSAAVLLTIFLIYRKKRENG